MSEQNDNVAPDPEDLPATAGEFGQAFPGVWNAYNRLGKACSESGPISGDTKRLVKLALSIASESEGAVHSHVRRALEEGIEPERLRQVTILAIPTIGFPKAMAALTWIDDLT